MMKINRKWALGIGVAAIIGAAFWMRALASWRPVTVAKVGFAPDQLKFSRDGQFLLVKNIEEGTILNLQNGVVDTKQEHASNFAKNLGLQSFPRFWFDEDKWQLFFSWQGQKAIKLETAQEETSDGKPVKGYVSSFRDMQELATGWSKERNEVHCATRWDVFTWNGSSGKLKKSISLGKISVFSPTFSPDGKWLMAFEGIRPSTYALRRYDLQSGKAALVSRGVEILSFGFASDGKSIWLVKSAGGWPFSFHLLRAADFKELWTVPCAGPVHWLPDGRLGIVLKNGFEWRDATGQQLTRLLGPFQGQSLKGAFTYIDDWALSPDENWIYSCQNDGTIRRWRAR